MKKIELIQKLLENPYNLNDDVYIRVRTKAENGVITESKIAVVEEVTNYLYPCTAITITESNLKERDEL